MKAKVTSSATLKNGRGEASRAIDNTRNSASMLDSPASARLRVRLLHQTRMYRLRHNPGDTGLLPDTERLFLRFRLVRKQIDLRQWLGHLELVSSVELRLRRIRLVAPPRYGAVAGRLMLHFLRRPIVAGLRKIGRLPADSSRTGRRPIVVRLIVVPGRLPGLAPVLLVVVPVIALFRVRSRGSPGHPEPPGALAPVPGVLLACTRIARAVRVPVLSWLILRVIVEIRM